MVKKPSLFLVVRLVSLVSCPQHCIQESYVHCCERIAISYRLLFDGKEIFPPPLDYYLLL